MWISSTSTECDISRTFKRKMHKIGKYSYFNDFRRSCFGHVCMYYIIQDEILDTLYCGVYEFDRFKISNARLQAKLLVQ